MPKVKTSSGAKKRFKVTGTGKLMRRHAMQSHNLGKKTAKRKRDFSSEFEVHANDTGRIKKLLRIK